MDYKVLLVDDSKLARIIAKRVITSLRPTWMYSEADGAESALKAIHDDCPHVIIVDYNMPDRHGLDLAEEIKRLYPTIVLAMLSANKQDTIIKRATDMGLSYFSKPVKPEELAAWFDGVERQLESGERGRG